MCNFFLKKPFSPTLTNFRFMPPQQLCRTFRLFSLTKEELFWIDVQWFFRSAGTSANSEIQLVAPGRSGRKRGIYFFLLESIGFDVRWIFFFCEPGFRFAAPNRNPGCPGSGSHFVLNWRGVKNDEKRISGYTPKNITVNDFPRCAIVHNWIHFWKSPNFWQKKAKQVHNKKKSPIFLNPGFWA